MTKQQLNETMKQIGEFKELQEQLKIELEALQDEVKQYMIENDIDEVVTDEGKATYRDVISNRFDSTSFKKDFLDIYKEYVKQTTCKRFTYNK